MSSLGRWFLPKDRKNKAETLMCFDDNLLSCEFGLPSFWSDEYSEQFAGANISDDDVRDFIGDKFEGKDVPSPSQINKLQIMVYATFRKSINSDFIKGCFGS